MHSRSRRRILRPTRLAVAGLFLLVLIAPLAEAHANLVSAEPRPNTRVEQAPAMLILSFSERLEDAYTNVEVLDDAGRDHVRELHIDPERRSRLAVHLEPLEDGIHTVRWRTLSGDDGHTTTGAYLLAVGVDFPPDAAPAAVDHGPGISPSETLLRTLAYLGSALSLGGAAFLLWTPVAPEAARRRLVQAVPAGAAVAALAAFSLLVVLGIRIGVAPWEAAQTAFGRWNLVRALLLLAAAGAGAWALRAPRAGLIAAAALTALAGLAAAMVSHAAAMPQYTLHAITIHWLHFLVAALWIGMVVGVLAVLSSQPRPEHASLLVRRFSPRALGLVAVLVATGIYLAQLHIESSEAARGTAYGAALALKVLLLLGILGLAALHRYLLLARMEQGGGLRRMRHSVVAEVVLMVGVLVAAGVLAHAPPPHDHSHHDHHHGLPGEVHRFGGQGHELVVTILPQPVRVGIQNVSLHLDPGPAGIPENANAFLQFTDPHDQEGPLQRMDRLWDDRWSLRDAHFTEAGEWQVRVVFQGRGVALDTTFRLEVA